jgi:hypothetical protein
MAILYVAALQSRDRTPHYSRLWTSHMSLSNFDAEFFIAGAETQQHEVR